MLKIFLFFYYYYMIIKEMSSQDQKLILDLEQQILNLKRDIIDANKEDADNYKLDIENLKQQITDIKDRAKNDDLNKKESFHYVEKILFEFGRSEDLTDWNKKQFELWLDLEKKDVVKHNDAEKFAKFGAFFYDFWNKNKRIPKVSEVLGVF